MDGVPLRAQSALAVNALARYVWGLTARRAWQRPARSVLQREGRVLHLPSGWESGVLDLVPSAVRNEFS